MKILIVDDERIIREGIRSMIASRGSGLSATFEASNGIHALKVIADESIDIVVTDIKMHDMDGIALLKEAGRLKTRPEFIVLSGYDDFQYAKESIRYGVKAYLLKPVKRTELLEAIDRVEQELGAKRSENTKLENMSQLIGDVWEHELNYLIMHENLNADEMGKITAAIGIQILQGEYYVGIAERRKKKLEGGTVNDCQSVKRMIYDFTASRGHSCVAFGGVDDNIVLIAETEEVFCELAERLNMEPGDGFAIGTSRKAGSVSGLRQAYLEAAEALKYKILRNAESLIRFDAVDRLNKTFTPPSDLIEKVVRLVGTTRSDELNALLNRLFGDQDILSRGIRYAERLAEEAYRVVIEPFIGESGRYRSTGTQFELLQSIYNFDYINDYIYAFKKFVFDINACLIDLAESYKGMNEINEAMDFVNKNYQKDLNLSVVANHVSLNYSYFSNLFSEKTGLNFHDYLKTVRIDKSKELLLETDSRINEIAKKVGYKNPKHFATHFRALTGISPLEYRKVEQIRKM